MQTRKCTFNLPVKLIVRMKRAAKKASRECRFRYSMGNIAEAAIVSYLRKRGRR